MPNQNCPVCGNRDRVYEHGNDPKYGDYVLCSRHGIQVCKKEPETQRAYFQIALRHLKEQGSGIHQRSE